MEFEGVRVSTPQFINQMEAYIRLEGYLDSINSEQVLQALNAILLNLKGINGIVLDLRKLTYASSTGIGILTTLLMNCKKRNIELELHNLNGKVMDVISLLGFASFFKIRNRE